MGAFPAACALAKTLALAVFGLAAVGCSREAVPEERRAGGSAGAEADSALRRLEDLGYLAAYQEVRPGATGVVHDVPARRARGLNLVLSSHRPGAALMDATGGVLHEWSVPFEVLAPRSRNPKDWWRRAVLLPDGDLLVIFDYWGLVRLDRDSRVLWAALGTYHHDAFVDAEGRTWALYSRRTEAGPQSFVRVLDAGGEVEREISLDDALLGSPHAPMLRRLRGQEDPSLHVNEITWLDGTAAARLPAFRRGNLLVSPRNLDAVAVLDPRTETVEWLLTGSWARQHTPSLLPNGRLLLFDNLGAGDRSRALELDPRSGRVLWSWDGGDESFLSGVMGAAQGLANGNVLVVDSTGGRVFEVTRDGAVVWEYRNPHTIEEEGKVKVASLPHVERLSADLALDWLPGSR